ncbi:MAG: glutamate--cysteine ligase [Candidatus Melainabacteria bacterium]|nr:glutamate--cysteine ligase [Candidatus Melainabacteria bacterium]
MTCNLLKKGLEVELYAGTEAGEVLPLSTKLKEKFSDFSQEPDERNFEYITNPVTSYNELFNEIIQPRLKVRKYLKDNGQLTLIPGSTIPLPFSKDFYRSKADDPYHEFILNTYKTNVITTSLHINIGIDSENLFKLLCALRLDIPLLLALSASSCFHDGKVTGYHSYRWHNFPKTPEFVPFFTTHEEYIKWTNEQLSSKKMLNVRHLWTSIRPNGPDRPHDLNRLEIRICDLVSDTKKVLAIVAFIECIIQKYLLEGNYPKILSKKQKDLNDLVITIGEQEELIAKSGLNAKIWDWRGDTEIEAYKIIETLYKDLKNTASKLDILKYLNPITGILKDGNEATQFLEMYNKNKSIQQTIQYFIKQFTIMDSKALDMIKNPVT